MFKIDAIIISVKFVPSKNDPWFKYISESHNLNFNFLQNNLFSFE